MSDASRQTDDNVAVIHRPAAFTDEQWSRCLSQLRARWAQELAWLTYQPVVVR